MRVEVMIRDEVLMDLVHLARTDPEFMCKARADLEGTLNEYGYQLTGDELAAVKAFHRRTRGMSDEELTGMLAKSAHEYVMRGA
jgi:hypothetical protein